MDIFDASNTYENNLTLVETGPLNNAFDFYGIGGKIMLLQSGSYFVM
jgi:hypothetical protein